MLLDFLLWWLQDHHCKKINCEIGFCQKSLGMEWRWPEQSIVFRWVAFLSHYGRQWVWNSPSERYAPVCIDERHSSGNESVMVWTAISSQAQKQLVFIQNGSLAARLHYTEISKDQIMPFVMTNCGHGIFMKDNARSQEVVREYLDRVRLRQFD